MMMITNIKVDLEIQKKNAVIEEKSLKCLKRYEFLDYNQLPTKPTGFQRNFRKNYEQKKRN